MANGRIIGVSNSPTSTVASGIWSLNEQLIAVGLGNWPVVSTPAPPAANLLDLIGTGSVSEELGTLSAEAATPFASGQTVSADWTGNNRIKVYDFNPDWDSDWTTEFWFRFDDLLGSGSTKVLISTRTDGSGWGTLELYLQNLSGSTTVNMLGSSTNNSWDVNEQGSQSLSADTWYHVAAVKNGTSLKCYINGSENCSGTLSSASYSPDPNYMYVGDFGPGGFSLEGNFSNLRFSDTARYTTTFTAPSEAFTDDSNTVFLMPFNET